jgi:hypothetical protein
MPVPNTGLAKVAVQCSADTFVVNHPPAGGLRINICGENRHLRKAENVIANGECRNFPYLNIFTIFTT